MAATDGEELTQVALTGEQESEVIIESEILFEEREGYAPEREYVDQSGKQYWLKAWNLEPYRVPERRKVEERTVRYENVELVEQIPKKASVFAGDKITGQQLQKECPILHVKFEKERWVSDFAFTAVFHSYDADYYQLGGKKIPYNSLKPELDGCEPELLAEIGVNSESYRILHADWKGNSYFDENGNLCRNAEITGEKKISDCYVTYGGEIVFPEAEGIRCVAVYRGFNSATDGWEQAGEQTVGEIPAKSKKKGGMWKVVWKGIVITLSLVLVAGAIFLVTFLVRRAFRRKSVSQKE
ncbi:MAG: hypothetical protein QM683_03445 [Lacrimispora sp.]